MAKTEYTLPEKTCVIEFDEYPGLEVELLVSPIPLGEYIEATAYVDDIANRLEKMEDLYELADFVDRYRRGSTLTTPTREWPHTLLLSVAVGWQRAVGQVMPPLPRVSSGTARFLGASSDLPSSTEPSSSTPSSEPTPATP